MPLDFEFGFEGDHTDDSDAGHYDGYGGSYMGSYMGSGGYRSPGSGSGSGSDASTSDGDDGGELLCGDGDLSDLPEPQPKRAKHRASTTPTRRAPLGEAGDAQEQEGGQEASHYPQQHQAQDGQDGQDGHGGQEEGSLLYDFPAVPMDLGVGVGVSVGIGLVRQTSMDDDDFASLLDNIMG